MHYNALIQKDGRYSIQNKVLEYHDCRLMNQSTIYRCVFAKDDLESNNATLHVKGKKYSSGPGI